jgi:hypothetical protein
VLAAVELKVQRMDVAIQLFDGLAELVLLLEELGLRFYPLVALGVLPRLLPRP